MADTFVPIQRNVSVAPAASIDYGALGLGEQGRILMQNNDTVNAVWFSFGTIIAPAASDGAGRTRLRAGEGFAMEVIRFSQIAFSSAAGAPSVDVITTQNPGIGGGVATT